MKKFQLAFYIFFFLFNSLYLVYNLLTGFDWSKALIPFLITIVCGRISYSILKEGRQSK